MKDIDNIFEDDSWIILILILTLLNKENLEKEQPIINIYLGDE